MAVFKSYAHGQFCWIDLMAPNAEAAKMFYGDVFGWTAEEQDTQGGPPYIIFTKEGQQLCGLGEMNDQMQAAGMPAFWNSYLKVDDLESALSKATELGATIIMPAMQVMDAGRMAAIQDPAGGNVFFWQPLQHCGTQLANVPGTWVWNELMTRDPQAAQTFYSQLFGWTFEEEQGSPNDYWVIENGGRKNGGILGITPEMGEMPACWCVYFNVSELSISLGKVQKCGGEVYKEPFDSSVGPIAVVADNQGAMFNLLEMNVPPDE